MRLILADRKTAQQVLDSGASASSLHVVTATTLEEALQHLNDTGTSVLFTCESLSGLEALRHALAGSNDERKPVAWLTAGLPVTASPPPMVSTEENHEPTPSSDGDSAITSAGTWLGSLSGSISEAVLRIHGGRLAEWDRSFARKVGFSVIATPGTRVGNLFVPSDRYALHVWLKHIQHMAESPSNKGAIRLTMRGEEGEFPVSVSHMPSTGSRQDTLLLVEPVGECHLLSHPAELFSAAELDPLTGLPDHDWFLESVRKSIARARYLRQRCFVLVCRLEGIQAVSRELGEDAAKEACQTAAIRLRRAAGHGASLARIRPYEFACVFVSNDVQGITEQQILCFQRVIRPPVTGGSVPMHLSLRFGASEYSSRMERPRALVRLARTRAAMAFLLEQPIARIPAQSWSGAFGSSLEQEIDRAFERNEFEVFLQPIIHLRSFAIRGAEVLVRWRHPERGLLSPSHFLPMAESTGQVACIGQWVLESVCANASKWGRQLQHRPRFSVNISPVELHDHRFLATTLAILDRYPLHSFEIELEITETAVLASESKTAEVVESLRRQGIKTALDDFGAGYSSLSHLREIPFSKLKIDRTFVHGALASRRCRTIVRSMVELARGLRIEVTAEGVENPEQLRLLYEAGCDEAQGYLFARPMPPHRFDSWVAGYQGKASEAFDRAERQRTETNGKVVPFQRNPSPA